MNLIGRSELNADQLQKLETLQALGAHIDYRQVDVTDKQSVESLIKRIQHDVGKLTAILHSAGVNHDNFIIKKSRDEFARVLAPKVAGTCYLDVATQGLDLDVFILFSSVAGVMGNIGHPITRRPMPI